MGGKTGHPRLGPPWGGTSTRKAHPLPTTTLPMLSSQRLRPIVGITIAYALAGLLALQLAIPPGYVSPLYPAAGIALAGVLIYGNRVWPGIFIGSVIINSEAVLRSGLEGWSWIVPLCVGVGAVLQALAGAGLARRWVGFPNALDTQGAAVRFLFAAAPLSCLITPTFGVGALVLSGSIPADSAAFSWSSWWAGDAIGILIATPLTLALFGTPREDWETRRLAITLPMCAALILLGGLQLQIGKWEQQRLQSRFERDARNFSGLLRNRFADYLDVLQSTERIMVTAPRLTHDDFQHFADVWLSRIGGLQAIGWIQRATEGQLAAIEREARKVPATRDFAIRDRDSENRLVPLRRQAEYYPIRHIAPLARNRRALGVNVQSIPNSAEAIARTLQDGQAAASRAFELTQELSRTGKLGVVIYQRTRRGGTSGAERTGGIAFVSVRIEDVFSDILQQYPQMGIAYCLAELAPEGSRRLAGLEHCPSPGHTGEGGVLPWVELFDFAGRTWSLSFIPEPGYPPLHRGWESWTLIVIGLLSAGLLGTFLLVTSGRTRRIESLVSQRTAELADASSRLIAKQAILTHAERIARLGSWETQPATGRTYWSAELFHILGVPPEQPAGVDRLLAAIHPDDRETLRTALNEVENGAAATSVDVRLPARDGRSPIVHVSIEATRGPDGIATLRGTLQDITERRAAEAHIHYLAHYDTLTGLPNRAQWASRASQAIAFARRNQLKLAVLFLDLDNFKTINDTLGHPVGDLLLSSAARRLSACLRDEDVLARIGGDEFVILLPNLNRSDDAAVVARKLLASLTQPFDIDGQELTVSTSIGIAVYPGNGSDIDVLLKHADTAMYGAKSEGRNDFRFFTPDMNSRAFARLKLENALRRAIERDELILEYQPQWEMPEQRLIGVEALVRWQHPERGRINPLEFIPVAEESGLIHAIGDHVLRSACRQQVAWRAAGLRPVSIAVNISALQFRRQGFVERVSGIIAETGADPRGLDLELTESALMQPSPEVEEQLASLRGMGFGLALDDFGTGYSSLAYLKRMPLTHLKIDRSFVQDLPGDTEDAAIASATLSIARDLGLAVIAEGVETPAQRDFLLARQCRVMQGYLLSRPLPAGQLAELLGAPPPAG